MGDINQFEWIRNNIELIRPPILEIGSKYYTSEVSHDYRTLLAPLGEYVGTDLSPGGNVDVVADLTTDFAKLPEPLREGRFRTIICMSVMEHVRDVYRFAEHVKRLMADDAVAFISVPWVWRFHGYPSDYWRFSPESLRFLFDPLALDEERSCVSYQQPGRYGPLSSQELAAYPDYEADTTPTSRVGRFLLRALTRVIPLARPGKRQVLYPCMINAVFRS